MPGPAQKAKDQKMAADLVARGDHHGKRHHPTTQGTNYPSLQDVGSAAHRRARRAR